MLILWVLLLFESALWINLNLPNLFPRSVTMSVIERTNGVVKSRWRCLDSKNTGGLQFKPKISCDIIAACVVFQNYCRNRRIRDPEILPHILQDMREEQAEQSRGGLPLQGSRTRRKKSEKELMYGIILLMITFLDKW